MADALEETIRYLDLAKLAPDYFEDPAFEAVLLRADGAGVEMRRVFERIGGNAQRMRNLNASSWRQQAGMSGSGGRGNEASPI